MILTQKELIRIRAQLRLGHLSYPDGNAPLGEVFSMGGLLDGIADLNRIENKKQEKKDE